MNTDLDDGDEIEKLCSTILGAKFVRGDSYGVPGPLACVDEVVKRCAELERQNAAMREALVFAERVTRELIQDRYRLSPDQMANAWKLATRAAAALQPDAGRDFIPREKVKPLVDAHQKIWNDEEMGYITDGQGHMECGMCGGTPEKHEDGCPQAPTEAALAHAKTLGF